MSLSAETDQSNLAQLPTRERLVAAAADLLQLRGYAGVGVSEILTLAKATKGSLYFHFPGGKEELAAAALRQRGAQVGDLVEHLVASAPDAATAVTAFAAALGARLTESEFHRGCALATATLDAATESDAVRAAVREGYDRWQALLAGRIAADGLVEDPEAEAALVLAALEGALVLSRARQDPATLHLVARRLTAGWVAR